MHDTVDDVEWGKFLVSKDHIKRGNIILKLKEKGEVCLQQDLLYEPFSTPVIMGEDDDPWVDYGEVGWTEEIYRKDVALWAEFLLTHPEYLKQLNEFFNDK